MKKILFVMLSLWVLASSLEASITQTTCTGTGSGGGVITVQIIMDSGKWIGASVMDSSGNIEDIAPQKKSFGPSNYNFIFNSNASKYRVSTWKGYKGGLMHGRLADTGWIRCH